MDHHERYKQYLYALESACECRDTLLIEYYHRLLSSELHYYASIALNGLRRSLEYDLDCAHACAQEGRRWSTEKNLLTARLAFSTRLEILTSQIKIRKDAK